MPNWQPEALWKPLAEHLNTVACLAGENLITEKLHDLRRRWASWKRPPGTFTDRCEHRLAATTVIPADRGATEEQT